MFARSDNLKLELCVRLFLSHVSAEAGSLPMPHHASLSTAGGPRQPG